jgi:TolB protein
MRTTLLGACAALGAVLSAAPARAVVTGQIFGPGSESFPIAVVPLKDLGGDAGGALGIRFAQVLSRDLDLSGYFRLVDPKTFIEDPQTSGITAGDIDFVGWASLGAQALVKGGVSAAGDNVTVEVRLFDVPGRHDVPQASKRYSGPRSELPRMAHKAADAILEFLTGERGPFDSMIALVSNRSGRLKDVYRFTFDQTEPTRVTDERSLVVMPRWRPDGRALLFVSYREHFQHLFQVELPGGRQVTRLIPGPGATIDGAWSPDGSKLLVTRVVDGNTNIYLYDRGGQLLKRITDHWAIDVAPAWAPDGRRFAFCSGRTGTPQIYIMGVDGGSATRVSMSGNYNTSPAWSPKGDHLAWTTRAGGFQIVVAGADGSGARTITSAGNNENPSWAPDGRYLVFSSTRSGHAHLFLADRDGKTQKELTRGAADDTSPAWSPRLE